MDKDINKITDEVAAVGVHVYFDYVYLIITVVFIVILSTICSCTIKKLFR